MSTTGELFVRSGLIAARVLNILDGRDHYSNIVHARVRYDPSTDPGGRLELTIASAESQYSPPAVEAAMQQANQQDRAGLANLHATRKVPRQRQIGAALEAVVQGIASGKLRNEAGFREVLMLHETLKQVAYVDVHINRADARADNTRLRHEAQQLVGQGLPAAEVVVQYLDGIMQVQGPGNAIPTIGIETDVRDFLFLQNLAKGKDWGYVVAESGMLLLQGGKHREAIGELEAAVNTFGCKDTAIYAGLGEAYEGIGDLDRAIAAYEAVFNATSGDEEANAALARLYWQKASQTPNSVEPRVVRHDDLEAVMQLTPRAIKASHTSNPVKASQLYQLAVAYMTLEPQSPDEARQLLKESLALEPREETYSWLGEYHDRAASGTLYDSFPAGRHYEAGGAGAGRPSLIGRASRAAGRAVATVMTTPFNLRTPITLGRR